jgi:hypothetical protein
VTVVGLGGLDDITDIAGWLLNAPVDDVVEYLVELGFVECPQLLVEDVFQLEPTEVEQECLDFGERSKRRVVRFEFVVPFVGDKDVFTLRAAVLFCTSAVG